MTTKPPSDEERVKEWLRVNLPLVGIFSPATIEYNLLNFLAQVRAEAEKEHEADLEQLHEEWAKENEGLEARISTFEESSAADARCINRWAEKSKEQAAEIERLRALLANGPDATK